MGKKKDVSTVRLAYQRVQLAGAIQAIREANHLNNGETKKKGGDKLVLSLFRLDSVVCESWDKSV